MHIDIFTLFPEMFQGVFDHSIIYRAQNLELVSLEIHNIRDYALDKHHTTDDYPYGGGGGMVMKPEPIFQAVESVLAQQGDQPLEPKPPLILLTPQGRPFTQQIAQDLVQHNHLRLLCGRYEGVDERVRQYLITDQISIGDYVLSGGEIPAMVLVDAIVRLIPDLLGDPTATSDDSHATGLLEYPHYTRPPDFRGHTVPDILLSGHHAKVSAWRREQSLLRTFQQRPDLLERAPLIDEDRQFLETLKQQNEDDRS